MRGLQIAVMLSLASGCTKVVVVGAATSGGSSAVAGSTSSGSSGTTAGSSGGSATGSAAGSTGSSSGTTTGSEGVTGTPPYQGFDSGPHIELPTTCFSDADCGPNRFCYNLFGQGGECEPCRPEDGGGFLGCASGQVCDLFDLEFPFCTTDCRPPGLVCPAAEFCEEDSGACFPGCLTDSDCQDAGAVCYDRGAFQSVCFGCFGDAGCEPGELCGPSQTCQPNCLDAGISCPLNSICVTSMGLCTPGCATDRDCGGATPLCETALSPPLCAQCLTAADCPAGQPGCQDDPFCSGCPKTCGGCQQQSDCPPTLRCGSIGCECTESSECSGFPTTPACVGIAGQGASSYGLCGCETSSDCAAGFLCDRRLGYTVGGSPGSSQVVGGGICVPSCAGQDAGYCAEQYQAIGAPVCNPATGFCVPCLQDSDCAANASQPLQTPSCIPYPDGGYLADYTPFSPGGGRCGCSSTAACDDGWTCQNPSDAGQCIPPCTFVGGVDSCSDAFDSLLVLCNTFNGLCQQCLVDSDCDFGGDFCNASGNCVQCDNASQCPADLPGCLNGSCGFCDTAANCPAGEDFTCNAFLGGGHLGDCLLPCVIGDDAGLGSVSDAGPACPAAQPFCVTSPSDAGGSWCSECRGEGAFPNDCAHGFCCGTFCYSGVGCR